MNINHQIFKAITDNLNTVLDTVPAHPKIETREYEYYAMDVAFSSLMSYYTCRDNNQKEPKKLLSFVFNCGVIIRSLCDAEKDFGKRTTLVYDFVGDCDMWDDGWFERLLTNEDDRKNVEISRELTIEETTYLTYQKYGIEIEDNGKLQDMITVLVAIFMFGRDFDLTQLTSKYVVEVPSADTITDRTEIEIVEDFLPSSNVSISMPETIKDNGDGTYSYMFLHTKVVDTLPEGREEGTYYYQPDPENNNAMRYALHDHCVLLTIEQKDGYWVLKSYEERPMAEWSADNEVVY